MNKFLTLIRRDMADNRGALLITPLVITAIVLVMALLGSFTGNTRFGIDPDGMKRSYTESFETDQGTVRAHRNEDGRVIISTQRGERTIDGALGEKGKQVLSAVIPIGTSFAAALPLVITAFIVLFLLAGSLYDERKDRTILFWKSLPFSDLANSGAKMVSIIGVGFAVSFGAAIVLQLGSMAIALGIATHAGITGIDLGTLLINAMQIWIVGLVGLIVYIGWALPIYAWILMMSAAAPKAPFIMAMVPLFLAPAIAGILNLPGDIKVWTAPLARLAGIPGMQFVSGQELDSLQDVPAVLPIGEILQEITRSLTLPNFWIGLVVAGGFIYAASEIRRRRAL